MDQHRQQVQPHGQVYLLGNTAMPALYKIGHTSRDIKTRIAELSRGTAVPAPFYLVVALRSYQPRLVEMQVHSRLTAYRANRAREFFEFSDDREAAIAFLTQVVDSGVYEPVTVRPQVVPMPVPNEPPVELTPEQKAERKEKARRSIAWLRGLLADGGQS